jgi:IS5 family transposase
MADDKVKQQYKQRAATAECVNALARNRGLQRVPVRGLNKVRAVAYLYALAHNLMRMVKIAPQLIGWATGAPAGAAAAA